MTLRPRRLKTGFIDVWLPNNCQLLLLLLLLLLLFAAEGMKKISRRKFCGNPPLNPSVQATWNAAVESTCVDDDDVADVEVAVEAAAGLETMLQLDTASGLSGESNL